MPVLMFEGHSDDLFCESNHFHLEHDNCGTGKPIEYLVTADGLGIVVTGQYLPNNSGSWMIGVANHDPKHEDCDFPKDWNIRLVPQNYRNGFQPCLMIDAPDGVQVTCLTTK